MAARLDGCIERKLTADPGRRFSLLKFKLPTTCLHRTYTKAEDDGRGIQPIARTVDSLST